MQSISARAEYKNSFHCAYRIFTEEGIFAFWAGALPRLGRLMVSYRPDFSFGNMHMLITSGYRSAEALFSRCTRRLWKRSTSSTPNENTSKTLCPYSQSRSGKAFVKQIFPFTEITGLGVVIAQLGRYQAPYGGRARPMGKENSILLRLLLSGCTALLIVIEVR